MLICIEIALGPYSHIRRYDIYKCVMCTNGRFVLQYNNTKTKIPLQNIHYRFRLKVSAQENISFALILIVTGYIYIRIEKLLPGYYECIISILDNIISGSIVNFHCHHL